MRIKLVVATVLFAIIGFRGIASAQSVAGGGFTPNSPSEAPYVYHSNGAVINTDTASNHITTASLGVLFFNPGDLHSLSVHGSNNGQGMFCYLYLQDMQNTGNSQTYFGSTSANGYYSLPIAFRSTGGSEFAVTLQCFIPKVTSAFSYIYGARLDY
jgi:hypothetical protein